MQALNTWNSERRNEAKYGFQIDLLAASQKFTNIIRNIAHISWSFAKKSLYLSVKNQQFANRLLARTFDKLYLHIFPSKVG
ncbi:MAG: hypothetical protein ACOYJK_02075 [Prevotella sp.]|jgi:hypothetical protein